jgi:hypothetical protein
LGRRGRERAFENQIENFADDRFYSILLGFKDTALCYMGSPILVLSSKYRKFYGW